MVGRDNYNGGKIEIKSTRTDINAGNLDGSNVWRVTNGLSGNPALIWQPFMKNQMMRLNNDDWSDLVLHELSHDFDYYPWAFDPEVTADLKLYYVMETLGQKFIDSTQTSII